MNKTEVKMKTSTAEPGLVSFQVKDTRTLNIDIHTDGQGTRTCPLCGKEYQEHPAISRADNKTPICPDCGIIEALEAARIDKETQEEILNKIHELRKGAEE